MKKVGFLFILFFAFSCENKQPLVIPETIIPKDKMVYVLLDIHLMEASLNLNVLSTQGVTTPNNSILYIDIFKNHEITKKQFDESFLFYTQHPDILSEIYQEMITELSKMQAEVSNQ